MFFFFGFEWDGLRGRRLFYLFFQKDLKGMDYEDNVIRQQALGCDIKLLEVSQGKRYTRR